MCSSACAAMLCAGLVGLAGPAIGLEAFTLTSPELTDGGPLPADRRCQRDGVDGLSPPLEWTDVPA